MKTFALTMCQLTTIVSLIVLSSIQCVPLLSDVDNERPHYVECVDSNECSFDSCCVLGMGRYSVPSCQRKLHLNEDCRPESDNPDNSTVTYLDGHVVSLHNVHILMCPCSNGLVCNRQIGKCVDFDYSPRINEIEDHDNPFEEFL